MGVTLTPAATAHSLMPHRVIAMTTNAPAASLAELLCTLSFVSDLGMGQPMEHGLKTAYIGQRVAQELGLPAEDEQAVFYGALLKDAGCTACAAVIATF